MSMSVSVVIPAYNAQETLSRAVESVVSQKGVHEIIVVDDGSTDDTADVAMNFGKVRYVKSTTNNGVCNARNIGIREAKCELVTFLDADDELERDSISLRLNYLRSNNLDAVVGQAKFVYPDGKSARFPHCEGPVLDLVGRSLIPAPGNNVFAKRSALLEHNPTFYQEDWREGFEDFHALFRLCQTSRVGMINASICRYYQKIESSRSSDDKSMRQGLRRYCQFLKDQGYQELAKDLIAIQSLWAALEHSLAGRTKEALKSLVNAAFSSDVVKENDSLKAVAGDIMIRCRANS